MTFREMSVEDLEQVVEIEKALFSDPWTKEGFFTFLTKENTMFFVVEEKEKILAYCSMQTVLDEGDILNVAVRSDRQKEGIGYFLVDSMLKMAEMIGIHIVHLEVREGNGTARRLYERLGFKEDGLRRDYYTDPTENAVLMTKNAVNAGVENMLDLCLLGCGGMMPLPKRWLTALMTRYNGSSLLIDCGEGTQVAIKEKGWSFKPIDVICFTHYHGDHISGLPGLLLTMGNADRTEPLTLVGPKGLERVVNALRVIAPELPFEIKFIEITKPFEVLELNGYRINAFRVNHNVICYGYTIEILRQGKFSPERAREQEIPLKYWNPLQKGRTIEADGAVYTPDMVLGPDRKGIKVTYTTDTRPTESILRNAVNSDLFICEGMYGEEDKIEKAKGYKHMTFREAATLAKDAEVKELWLTHYSPSLIRPDEYMDMVRGIFPNAWPGKDGKSVELNFEEE